MPIKYLMNVIDIHKDDEAIIWRSHSYSYAWLISTIECFEKELINKNIYNGSVVALKSEFSPNSIAMLIALMRRNCIIVPITIKNRVKQEEYCAVSQVEYMFDFEEFDKPIFSKTGGMVDNPLLLKLKKKAHPGLVIFSSGSTGRSKAAVHDLFPLVEKFIKPKRRMRVIAFLLFDHIGGLNTLFYTLFNAGCLIIPASRSPLDVCESIDRYKAQALTTTPTFLNLLLLSGTIDKYELSSLRVINYGTEVMLERTLRALREFLPNARLSQAYGLSEVGVLPVRSKSSDSLFFKIDDIGFKIRIVDGLLEIKSHSSMLGYLNSANPMTEDGWFKTGDAVEVDGEYIRILGRKSELINVGGEKVYPAEIENVLQQINGVEQVSVFSEENAITGQIVVSRIKLSEEENLSDFRKRLHEFCKSRLPSYKIPQKIILTNIELYNERFKKIRLSEISNEK